MKGTRAGVAGGGGGVEGGGKGDEVGGEGVEGGGEGDEGGKVERKSRLQTKNFRTALALFQWLWLWYAELTAALGSYQR